MAERGFSNLEEAAIEALRNWDINNNGDRFGKKEETPLEQKKRKQIKPTDAYLHPALRANASSRSRGIVQGRK